MSIVNNLAGAGSIMPTIRVTAPTGSTVTCDGTQGSPRGSGETQTFDFKVPIKENTELPSEYQRVLYIQSTGTQWIDTEVDGDAGIKVDMTLSFADTSDQCMCGVWTSDSNRMYVSEIASSKWRAFYSNSTQLVGSVSANTKYNMVAILNQNYQSWTVNGTSVATSSNSNSVDATSLYLFARHDGSSASAKAKGKIYDIKIWQNNTLAFNGIPCYNKTTKVAGLYDTVSGEFFTNQGTGEFLVGAEVGLLPDWLQQCETLNSDGSSYVDTGKSLGTNDFEIACNCVVTGTPDSEQAYFSIWTSTYNYWNVYSTSAKSLRYYTTATHNIVNDDGLTSNVPHLIKFKRSDSNWTGSLDNTSVTSSYVPSYTNNTSLKVFTRGDASSSNHAKMNLDTLRMDFGSNRILNLIPCYALESHTAYKGSTETTCASGEAGLYDTVEGKFYINSGSGTFSVGDDVNYQKYIPYTIVSTLGQKSKTVSVVVDEVALFPVEIWYGRLPIQFQEVEWIKGDGSNNYLIVPYYLKYSDTVYFKGDDFPNSKSKIFFYANRDGSGGNANLMSVDQGYFRSEWFGKSDLGQYHTRTSDFAGHQFEGYMNATKVHYVWGSSQGTWDYTWNDSSTTIASAPISLFGRDDGNNLASAKAMYLYIEDSTQEKVIDLVPCYCTESVTGYKGSTSVTVPANTVGMYDLVNDRFYVNCGSGNDFTKGDDVE